MKTKLLVAIVLCATSFAHAFESVDTLAAATVQAINEKSEEKQLATYHPDFITNLSQPNRDFVLSKLVQERKRVVPKDYKVSVKKVGNVMPFAGMVTWPVKPEASFQIDYEETPEKSVTLIRWAAQKDNGWFRVDPIPNGGKPAEQDSAAKKSPASPK